MCERVQKATNAYYHSSHCLFGKEQVYGNKSWIATKNDISRINPVQMENSEKEIQRG